jgi:hypothetical protein
MMNVSVTIAHGTTKLYVDGELVQTVDNFLGVITEHDDVSFAIGQQGSNAGGGWNHFDGVIDDLQIHEKILTDNEVSKTAEGKVVQDALVLHYDFENDNGGVYTDKSGNGYTATPVDTPTQVDGQTTTLQVAVEINTKRETGEPTYQESSAIDVTYIDLPEAGRYSAGDVLAIDVHFNDVVYAYGSPYITLDVGGVTRKAVLVDGAGTDTLTFAYEVQNESDLDGIEIHSTIYTSAESWLNGSKDGSGQLVDKDIRPNSTGRVVIEDGAVIIEASDDSANANFDLSTPDVTGTHGNDTIDLRDANAQSAAALGGDDTIMTKGEDEVLAGTGDDRIIIGDATFDLIHGGSGNDTIALDPAFSGDIDVTSISNKIRDIETIDLRGAGDNTLQLTSIALEEITNGQNTLVVNGDAGDNILFSVESAWDKVGTEEVAGTTYDIYSDGTGTMKVSQDVNVTISQLVAPVFTDIDAGEVGRDGNIGSFMAVDMQDQEVFYKIENIDNLQGRLFKADGTLVTPRMTLTQEDVDGLRYASLMPAGEGGEVSFVMRAVDPDGHFSTHEISLNVLPDAPRYDIVTITNETITGTDENGVNYSTSPVQVISGTAEPFSTVHLYERATHLADIDVTQDGAWGHADNTIDITVNADGTWSYATPEYGENTYVFHVSVTDEYGTTHEENADKSVVVIDHTVGNILIDGVSDGFINSTEATTTGIHITGRTQYMQEGDRVVVSIGSIEAEGRLAADGTYDIFFAPNQLSQLSNGKQYVINATVYDAAGNSDETMANITVDVVATIALDDISGGYINAQEKNEALTIAGFANGLTGEEVTITNGHSGATYTATVQADGRFSVTVPAADVQSLPASGNVSFTARASDEAGNIATAAKVVTIDVTAGSISIHEISDGTVTSAEHNSPLTITGTTSGVDVGTVMTLEYKLQGTNSGLSKTATVQADGTWSVTFTADQAKDLYQNNGTGTYIATVSATDNAGNTTGDSEDVTVQAFDPNFVTITRAGFHNVGGYTDPNSHIWFKDHSSGFVWETTANANGWYWIEYYNLGGGGGVSWNFTRGTYEVVSTNPSGEVARATVNGGWYDPIADLEDGGFIVTWVADQTVDKRDSDGQGIYAQRYDKDGNPVSEKFQVNTHEISDQTDADVVGLSDGGYVVVWQSFLQDGSGWGVYGQRYDENNNQVNGEFLINTTTEGHQISPEVTSLSNEGFVVTWVSENDTGMYDVYVQMYNQANEMVNTEILVNAYDEKDHKAPQITAIDDKFIVTWQTSEEVGSSVHTQIFTNDGVKAGSNQAVARAGDGSEENPFISTLGNGDYIVSWLSEVEGGYNLMAQRYNMFGEATTLAPFQLNSTLILDVDAIPEIVGLKNDPNNGFVAIWTNLDSDDHGIYVRRFADDGRALTAETLVNEGHESANQTEPHITALRDGGYMTSWSNVEENGDITIMGKMFDENNYAAKDVFEIGEVHNYISPIHGTVGSDYITGDEGIDEIYGNAGNDEIVYDADDAFVSGGGNYDKLIIQDEVELDLSKVGNVNKLDQFEEISLQSGATINELNIKDIIDIHGGGDEIKFRISGDDSNEVDMDIAGQNAEFTKTDTKVTTDDGKEYDVYQGSYDGHDVTLEVESGINIEDLDL